MNLVVEPLRSLRGLVSVPPDKSISHRALMIGSMAHGRSRIAGRLMGGDVRSTMAALGSLGMKIEEDDFLTRVEGHGWQPRSGVEIDAGNSGTTMRLLTGALSGNEGEWRLTGDDSLRRRPMGRIRSPLESMGARIDLAENECPPVSIWGSRLTGINYDLPVASSQVKGAIVFAALQAAGRTEITEATPTRDHTERILSWLGADVIWSEGRIEVGPSIHLPAFDLEIPGDFSSASYLLVAACLLPNSNVEIEKVGVNPSRTGLLDVLREMGAAVSVGEESADPEPIGSISIKSSSLRGVEVGGALIPRTIDELLLVAVAATQCEGETRIVDAQELRVKESNRITSLADGLKAMGANIEEQPDGLVINGPTPLSGAIVDSANDHRVALSLAVAAFVAQGKTTIQGWECTEVSYPGFIDDVKALM